MADRTCPNCKKFFNFPSRLKLHFQTVIHCKKSTEDITSFFLDKKTIHNFSCNKCNITFIQISLLNRHLKNSKCAQTPTTTISTTTIPTTTIPTTTIPTTIIQTINSNNNNTTNNNTINILHINPFGLEDVRTIAIPEMITILSSGENAGFNIIKAIYSKLENKNFYKPNISRPEIAFLNIDFNLTICKSKEFCDALFDRCIALLHHMLYLCKNQFSSVSIRHIYDNIEYIENTMRTEIYDKKLQNIIESEFRNNNLSTKDKIKKFIYEVKNNIDIKEISQNINDNTLLLEDNSHIEYIKTITNDILNTLFGSPIQILESNKPVIMQDFLITRFEDTIFNKFWINRIKLEKDYINTNKKIIIGDINYIKYRHSNITKMLYNTKKKIDEFIIGQPFDFEIHKFIRE